MLSSERGGLRRPRVSTEASPVLIDLIHDILSLYESDPAFALAGMAASQSSRSQDDAGDLLSATSSLVVGQGPDNIKMQAKRALVAILHRVDHDMASRPDNAAQLGAIITATSVRDAGALDQS